METFSSATFVDKSHEFTVALIRPLSSVRGAGRVASPLNSIHLILGSKPLKTAQLRDGSKLVVDLRSQSNCRVYYSGLYDKKYIDIIKRLMSAGGNVLDVGANIGLYCIQIANSVTINQKIFCFEPVPSNHTRLLENIQLNSHESKIKTFEYGLSDNECEAKITLREDFQGGATTGNAALSISSEADSDFDTTKIRLRRLDDLIHEVEFGDVRVIKLDIEGHEDRFLEGAQKFIELHQPIIFSEINKPYYRWRDVELNETFRRVIPHNYSIYKIEKLGSRLDVMRIDDLNSLGELENVFLCPAEAEGRLRGAVLGDDKA